MIINEIWQNDHTKITYRNAAKMIGVSIHELLDIMEKEGIDIVTPK
ncbi:MAG: hypothetical protein WBB08_01535 [Halobacteriota archaeon]|jgi:phage antirepressor YoqD-like protein